MLQALLCCLFCPTLSSMGRPARPSFPGIPSLGILAARQFPGLQRTPPHFGEEPVDPASHSESGGQHPGSHGGVLMALGTGAQKASAGLREPDLPFFLAGINSFCPPPAPRAGANATSLCLSQ